MRVGVIDDACTLIHTIQTIGQCITCAVHSEWCTHYTILHRLVLYTIAIEHTGTIYCMYYMHNAQRVLHTAVCWSTQCLYAYWEVRLPVTVTLPLVTLQGPICLAIATADNIGHICMYTWLCMFNKVNINALTVEPIGLRGWSLPPPNVLQPRMIYAWNLIWFGSALGLPMYSHPLNL